MCRRRDPERGTALTNRLKAVEEKITSIARKCGIGKKGKEEARKKSKVVKDAAEGSVTESIFESQASEEDGEGSDDDEDEDHSDEDEDGDDGAEQSALGALSFLGIDMDSQWSQ
jgi:hypothetical protein